MWRTTTAPRLASANGFLAEVRVAVAFLETYPLGTRVVTGEIRGKPLGRFRHTLLYTIESNEVVILAVAHQRQDLETWLQIVRTRLGGA